MKTGMQQHTGLRQELRINPRLYQAMDMLYMPMLDLQQHLQQELLNNPFLELEEPEDEEKPEKTTEQEQEEVKKDDEIDWEEILLNGFDVGGSREQFESSEYIEPVTVESRDLADYLRDQLQMLDLQPRQQLLCEEIVGNINDDGYLACSMEEILDSTNQWVISSLPGMEREVRSRRSVRPRRSRRCARGQWRSGAPRWRGALHDGGARGSAQDDPGTRPTGHRIPRPA